MFKQIFKNLCDENGITPANAMRQLGLSNSVYSKWTDTSLPHSTTLIKIAKFFNVTIEYLKGETTQRNHQTTNEYSFNSELSAQERALIEIFRSTTDEGRLEMITAIMNIYKGIEKKSLLRDASTFRQNEGA